MSGPRIALGLAGSPAATVLVAARLAEASNVDLVVIGDRRGAAPNSDDSYVLTTAGAVAATTRSLRIAVALSLHGSAPVLRVAEDLGVLDVMSAGRIEIVTGADLGAVRSAWLGWPLPDGSTAPVTPAPVQPGLPVWRDEVFVDWPGRLPDAAWLKEIRRIRDDAGAATVVVDIGAVPADEHASVICAVGTVVGPCLRCPANEVDILALDTTDWLLHRTALHHPPLP